MCCKNYIHLLPTIKLYPSNTLSGAIITTCAVSTHLSFIILIKWWLDDEQVGSHHHPPPRPFGTAFISGSWMGPPWCLILRGCWLSGLIKIFYLFAIQNWPLSQINPPIEPPSPHLHCYRKSSCGYSCEGPTITVAIGPYSWGIGLKSQL